MKLFFGYFFLILFAGISALFTAAEGTLAAQSKQAVGELLGRRWKWLWSRGHFLRDPDQLLGTLIAGRGICKAGGGAAIALLVTWHIQQDLPAWGIVLIACALLIFLLAGGEMVPRMLGRKTQDSTWIINSRFAGFIIFIFYLPSRFLILAAGVFARIRHRQLLEPAGFVTEEEVKELITAVPEEELGLEERQMIDSIFEFGETKVLEVMVPRTEMACLEAGTSLESLLPVVVNAGHSRIPVYQNSLDNIAGVLYAKDLLRLSEEEDREKFNLTDFVRQAYFVPETKKVNELLGDFQRERIHMAIVVDEYGGTAGLVTLEDLIEEIVGEIKDEYDKESKELERIDNGEIMVRGGMHVRELNEELRIDLPEEEGAETIAGFVINQLGRVPRAGEEVSHGDLRFQVIEASRRRITKLKIIPEKRVR